MKVVTVTYFEVPVFPPGFLKWKEEKGLLMLRGAEKEKTKTKPTKRGSEND